MLRLLALPGHTLQEKHRMSLACTRRYLWRASQTHTYLRLCCPCMQAEEYTRLQGQLCSLTAWPIKGWGGEHGSLLTLIDSTPQTPGRSGAGQFLPALCQSLSDIPAAAHVRSLAVHRSVSMCALRHAAMRSH